MTPTACVSRWTTPRPPLPSSVRSTACRSIDDADPAAGPGVLRVSVADRDTVAALNAALVGAGVGVHALVPERSSLEDVFLSLVEGADVPR